MAHFPFLSFHQLLPNIKIGPKHDDEKTAFHKITNKTLWLIGTARNAIIVIAGGALAAYFYENGHDMFRMIGDIPGETKANLC
jgi:solute carrier family 26 (sodium-independent sulfate anion transporter), member 11